MHVKVEINTHHTKDRVIVELEAGKVLWLRLQIMQARYSKKPACDTYSKSTC